MKRRKAIASPTCERPDPTTPETLLKRLSLQHRDDIKDQASLFLVDQQLQRHMMFVGLSRALREQVLAQMLRETFTKGSFIATNEKSDKFYIVQLGECVVGEAKSEPRTLTAGDSFGDLSLVQKRDTPFTMLATTDVVLWSIEGTFFRMLVHDDKLTQYYELRRFLLITAPWLSGFGNPEELDPLLDNAHIIQFKRGDGIITPNSCQAPGAFLIVSEGEVELTCQDSCLMDTTLRSSTSTTTTPEGECKCPRHRVKSQTCFGFENEPHHYTAIAATDTCVIVAIDRSVLSQLPHLRHCVLKRALMLAAHPSAATASPPTKQQLIPAEPSAAATMCY